MKSTVDSGGNPTWPTSVQNLRSTDLPSLRTQSSMRVLMPFPHTALSLSWQVLQSAGRCFIINIKMYFMESGSEACGAASDIWLFTCDVVRVVEAIAVQCAGLQLLGWRALLLCSRLAEQVCTPLPGTVPSARLRSENETNDEQRKSR